MKKKRRKYLVNKGVQFRYIRLVIIPLVALLVALYYYIYYSVFRQMLIPEAVATTLLPAMKKVNLGLAVTAPFMLFFIIKAALIYSNRIVGPIPRLERELDKVIAGDYSVRIKARNNDELRGFIEKINTLLETVDKSRPG
ncbi:hypothetical protein OAA99_01035 [Omnitrophica bacterium]|nr:hypothetical protein [Candidatus Omnitrophota bacterium]